MTDSYLNTAMASMFSNTIESWIEEYATNSMESLMKTYFEKREFKYNEDDEAIEEMAIDIFNDCFIEDAFNDWDKSEYSFYKEYEAIVDENMKVPQFIWLLQGATKYYKEFGIGIGLSDEERIWNSIAYYVMKGSDFETTYESVKETFVEAFKETYYDYKDYNTKTSRIPCGICYENRTLYTGCHCCNGNYLCKTCWVNVNNRCPFCRSHMTTKESYILKKNRDFWSWYIKLTKSLRNIESRCNN